MIVPVAGEYKRCVIGEIIRLFHFRYRFILGNSPLLPSRQWIICHMGQWVKGRGSSNRHASCWTFVASDTMNTWITCHHFIGALVRDVGTFKKWDGSPNPLLSFIFLSPLFLFSPPQLFPSSGTPGPPLNQLGSLGSLVSFSGGSKSLSRQAILVHICRLITPCPNKKVPLNFHNIFYKCERIFGIFRTPNHTGKFTILRVTYIPYQVTKWNVILMCLRLLHGTV